MRSVALLCLLVLAACRPAPKPPAPPPPPADTSDFVPDTGTVVDTGTVFDTSEVGRDYLDSLRALKQHSSQGASARAFLPSAFLQGYAGRPFGAFNMVEQVGSRFLFDWGPAPLNATITSTYPGGVCSLIAFHRAAGTRVNLFMTGGNHGQYKTNGRFDPEKVKAKLLTYNRADIRTCVAAGVVDGTVTGNALVDEPEVSDWGYTSSGDGIITKPMLDYLALYAKQYFPTLPMGVNHGASGYRWRASERFQAVDYVNYQYRWDAAGSQGNPAIYRDVALKQSAYDGVATSFSLNLLVGGRPDRDGRWDCRDTGQFGISPIKYGLCLMTPDQIDNFGTVLGTAQVTNGSVCNLLLWKYDDDYFRKAGVVQALGSVATNLQGTSRGSCRRP